MFENNQEKEFKESQSMFYLQQHGWCPFLTPNLFI